MGKTKRKPTMAAAAVAPDMVEEEDGELVRPAPAKGFSDAQLDGGFLSMRDAYDAFDNTDAYYESHGSDYRNPHEAVMSDAIERGLTRLEAAGHIDSCGAELRVLDVAAGSGEATIAMQQWVGRCASRRPPIYAACDPFTFAAYEQRLGSPCHRWSFEDVAGGALDDQEPFDVSIAGFCLHLVDKSYLHTTLSALSRACSILVLASPHKRPHITRADGWTEAFPEFVHERVHLRCYRSLARPAPDGNAVAAAVARAAAARAEMESSAAAAAAVAALDRNGGEEGEESAEGEESEGEEGEEGEDGEEGVDGEDYEEMVAEIGAMKVSALQHELNLRGLDSSGKRKALADRLLEARMLMPMSSAAAAPHGGAGGADLVGDGDVAGGTDVPASRKPSKNERRKEQRAKKRSDDLEGDLVKLQAQPAAQEAVTPPPPVPPPPSSAGEAAPVAAAASTELSKKERMREKQRAKKERQKTSKAAGAPTAAAQARVSVEEEEEDEDEAAGEEEEDLLLMAALAKRGARAPSVKGRPDADGSEDETEMEPWERLDLSVH